MSDANDSHQRAAMKSRPKRLYGKAVLADGFWSITADPQVLLRLKRLFHGIAKNAVGTVRMSHTPENCRDFIWFCERYPMDIEPESALRRGAKLHRDQIARVEDLLSPHAPPPAFTLAIPLRPYQAVGGALALETRGLLLSDELGLGKTVQAIATFTEPKNLPALVVCQPHLIAQWVREIQKFTPHLTVAVLTTSTVGPVPCVNGRGADVLVTSYHRISGWAAVLKLYCRSVVFDEVSELRRTESQKYTAAKEISDALRCRLGLSATPIYNYGSEMFSIMNVLKPGALGSREEFLREWCHTANGKDVLKNPEAFGCFLREQGLYLRRTKTEVGRELPVLTRITQVVDHDPSALNDAAEAIQHLAAIILRQTAASKEERFVAGGELDSRLRQATGIAKAPYVATFVRLLFEGSGEPVILTGWHRAVYEIWVDQLTRAGIRVGLYTGSESPTQKEETQKKFIAGDIDVMVLSLRSGLGIDGLQHRCATIVHGELDWSPAVHDQCNGRPHRDGQERAVTAYYLVSEDGSDPVIAETLGIKRDQLEGIQNPNRELVQPMMRDGKSIRKLAEAWLQRKHGRSDAEAVA